MTNGFFCSVWIGKQKYGAGRMEAGGTGWEAAPYLSAKPHFGFEEVGKQILLQIGSIITPLGSLNSFIPPGIVL